jgi:DnaA family protein
LIGHPNQLTLPIELIREPTLADYRPGPNAEASAAVRAQADGSGEPVLYLFGGPATGKTHLLQAACRASTGVGRTAQYIPLALSGLMPSMLEDLETRDLLALDDLDTIGGRPDWELAVFNLFNRARARGCALLIAATSGPDELGIGLPDLRSRLQWGPRYCLLPLSDPDCETLLIEVAARLGMRLAHETARYIMNNCARDPASLVELMIRIDRASLRERRQPSIPLVRQVIRGEI